MALFSTPTTVDGVLAAFNTTIANLQTVAAAQEAEASKQANIAAAALVAKALADAESARASKVVGQLQAIFK